MNFQSARHACEFIFAGNATFTLRSLRTGAHYTFKVKRAKDAERWFVNLLVAPDDYAYLGVIDDRPLRFRLTRASKHTSESKPVRALSYALGWLCEDVIPTELEVKHSGRCGRCGRTLTHPDSIDRGLGPECWGKGNVRSTGVELSDSLV